MLAANERILPAFKLNEDLYANFFEILSILDNHNSFIKMSRKSTNIPDIKSAINTQILIIGMISTFFG